jgi:hypothetical protein
MIGVRRDVSIVVLDLDVVVHAASADEHPEPGRLFGTPVYAPCDGTIEATEETLPHLAPPARDTARKGGNYVMLRCGPKAYVFLSHFRHESLQVHPGDSVSTGTRLGTVGNSGNSWEPHLHISAQESLGASTLVDADPRPMTFDGRFLVRNDVIRTTKSKQ